MHPFAVTIKTFVTTSKAGICIAFSHTLTHTGILSNSCGTDHTFTKQKNVLGTNDLYQGFRQTDAGSVDNKTGGFQSAGFPCTLRFCATLSSMSTEQLFLCLALLLYPKNKSSAQVIQGDIPLFVSLGVILLFLSIMMTITHTNILLITSVFTHLGNMNSYST